MIDKIKHILRRIREGMIQDMWMETKWIYQYGRRYWPAMVFYTLLGLVNTVFSLFSSLLSRDMVDIITGHRTGELLETFALMIGFAVGNIFISQLTGYASNWISIKVDNEIKADIFSKMLVTDWESITSYHTGDLLTRWNSDVSNISNGILNWIPNVIIYLFRFISALIIVIYHDASFAFFALLGVPVSLLMSRTLLKRMRNNNQRSTAMNAKMSGFHQEAFANIQTIKAFDMISVYKDYLSGLQKDYFTMKMDFQKMSVFTSIIMSLTGLIVSYSSYGWGIYRVWSGAITYGTMTMFLSLSGTLTNTLNSLISLVPASVSLTTSARRLMDILEMPKEDYSHDDEVSSFFLAHKEQGIGIALHNVTYAYQNSEDVLKNISFSALPDEITAIVGPSGEGKTTLLRILLSLLHPHSGEAVLFSDSEEGEQDLSLSPSTRKFFSYVPQGNTMFSGTIAENMRNVKPDATDTEIMEALQSACAWDFVAKLPNGIYSKIKERGVGLSEGQAQRLSIARALLRKSPILLLDEATSALDIDTEKRVLENIMKSDYPRTCILITHRLSVLKLCTRVYRIKDKHCTLLPPEESCADV